MREIYIRTDIKIKLITYISIGSIFILFFLLATDFNQRLFAQDEDTGEIDDSIGRVLNDHDAVLGLVKNNGQITNRFGALLGSVDDDGTIYNVSKISIGKVDPLTREVLNQSGTVLGLVTPEGDVFNNNGDKLGSVLIDSGGIILVGGAARLIFFRR
ncbi:5-fold beta-flower protein [Thermodesulfobacteriota bacterium]